MSGKSVKSVNFEKKGKMTGKSQEKQPLFWKNLEKSGKSWIFRFFIFLVICLMINFIPNFLYSRVKTGRQLFFDRNWKII